MRRTNPLADTLILFRNSMPTQSNSSFTEIFSKQSTVNMYYTLSCLARHRPCFYPAQLDFCYYSISRYSSCQMCQPVRTLRMLQRISLTLEISAVQAL